jgi:hypothetical protein
MFQDGASVTLSAEVEQRTCLVMLTSYKVMYRSLRFGLIRTNSIQTCKVCDSSGFLQSLMHPDGTVSASAQYINDDKGQWSDILLATVWLMWFTIVTNCSSFFTLSHYFSHHSKINNLDAFRIVQISYAAPMQFLSAIKKHCFDCGQDSGRRLQAGAFYCRILMHQ